MFDLTQFETAAGTALEFLQERMGLDLWMVTRTDGDRWVVLSAAQNGYGVRQGDLFRWGDSFCARMVCGEGPRIAPRAADIPAYAAAPIGRQVPIGAYVGIPLTRAHGSLFGTLCAIDPHEQPASLADELPVLELTARLLSSLLDLELLATSAQRRAERAEAESLTDGLTGLYNRRGWDRLLDAEEARCRRYGHPSAVIAVDVDGLKQLNDALGHAAGDDLLERTADALRAAVRGQDIVGRVGGDEFAVLAVECRLEGAAAIVARLEHEFLRRGVRASVGLEARESSRGLTAAWRAADQAMYANKRLRHRSFVAATAS